LAGSREAALQILQRIEPEASKVEDAGETDRIMAASAGMMVLQLIWVKTLVPETKGVPLEQIQKLGIK
jgi:hypothetical protein